MIAYIVCEGSFDEQLLKRVLPSELLADVAIVAAGGLSSVKSLARSLIVQRQVPVAIVADADSIDFDAVQERRQNIEQIVSSVSVDAPVKVILAVPTMEAMFFADRDRLLVSRLLGMEVDREILILATVRPDLALNQLISESQNLKDRDSIIDRLTDEDINILRQTPVIQEVINFLESIVEQHRLSKVS